MHSTEPKNAFLDMRANGLELGRCGEQTYLQRCYHSSHYRKQLCPGYHV